MISRGDREYLFIDGGCLRASVRKICQDLFGDASAYQPHVPALATGGYAKIFYYDAVPGKDHEENQAAYEARVQPDYDRFAKIQALDRVHVALGQIVGADKRQKGVDVRLAVDMMTHAFRGNISKATLFAGDSDFVPLVKSLVSEGLHVTLWHPPQANADLKGAADSTRLFDFKTNHSCLTADGQQSAFQIGSSGSGGHPGNDGLINFVTVGGHEYAGRWQDGTLRIWRCGDPGTGWSYVDFFAPDASLVRALTAFDLIYPWGIAAVGGGWIVAN
ncbi:NYN domain-containing protein [Mesorhizobium sp. YC-39]|uniref:NYN domain-containing protein n=1 Tax=unclassified Mesorhizobium TaxID=325217 RepID=UPI0021E6E0B6|nr:MULTISPECIES: NYN domain-containing protein [unclassified Mesorhizobium]MCV3209586.1 NYN domain-containing protein [Mesorhizobium sp. YC-2]MCV3230116.1 NYN domain-containing protein [Mesorhizobium sp. YC-39]